MVATYAECFVLTGEILRAARALARLEQIELAKAAGVSLETVKRLERVRGLISANRRTLEALLAALRRRDIIVEPHPNGGLALVWRGEGAPAATVGLIPEAPDHEARPLHRLVYHSRSVAPLAVGPQLEDILRESLLRNSQLGISGCLLAADGRFMQALEGDRAAVMLTYGLIAADARHRDLVVVENRPVTPRRFPNWVMCARNATTEEVAKADPMQARGFAPEQLSPAAALQMLDWFSSLETRLLAEGATERA